MRGCIVTLELSTEVQKEKIAKLQAEQTVAVSRPPPPPGGKRIGSRAMTFPGRVELATPWDQDEGLDTSSSSMSKEAVAPAPPALRTSTDSVPLGVHPPTRAPPLQCNPGPSPPLPPPGRRPPLPRRERPGARQGRSGRPPPRGGRPPPGARPASLERGAWSGPARRGGAGCGLAAASPARRGAAAGARGGGGPGAGAAWGGGREDAVTLAETWASSESAPRHGGR